MSDHCLKKKKKVKRQGRIELQYRILLELNKTTKFLKSGQKLWIDTSQNINSQ